MKNNAHKLRYAYGLSHVALILLSSVLVAGCNTYILSSVNRPNPPSTGLSAPGVDDPLPPAAAPIAAVAPDPRLNSLLLGAASWLAQRNYSFATNEVCGQVGFSAKFASPNKNHNTYDVLITTDPSDEVMTLSASAPDALVTMPKDSVPKFLTAINSTQNWGHYGAGLDDHTLFFRVSSLHLDSPVTSQELDRLMDEALKAMDSAIEWLSPLTQDDDKTRREKPEDADATMNQI
jgi:hypothetical protein